MSAQDAIEMDPDEEAVDSIPQPELSRIDRVAVLLMLLSDEEAAGLLARLEPDELQRIGAAMCEIGEIGRPAMLEAVSDFVEESSRELLPKQDRPAQVRGLLERSIGPTKAESMMLRIEPDARPRSIEMARWLAPSILLKLVEEEHPQVIAALLLMLEPDPAAEILSGLADFRQPDVVERVAKMGPVSQQAVAMIDALLSQRIGASFGANALTLGGPREAANLINLAAGELRGTVLPAIAQRDGPLAEKIEEELFTFEMLLELDPKAMERLLRDVDNEALVDALKGIDEEQRAPFFRSMSSGRLARTEVEASQRKIVEVARSLAEQGEIVMGGDDGEFV